MENRGNTSQRLVCVATRLEKLRDPAKRRIDTRVDPRATS